MEPEGWKFSGPLEVGVEVGNDLFFLIVEIYLLLEGEPGFGWGIAGLDSSAAGLDCGFDTGLVW